MRLLCSVAAIREVVGAFLWGVGAKEFANGGKDGFVGAGGGFSEPMLELGEDLLDRVRGNAPKTWDEEQM